MAATRVRIIKCPPGEAPVSVRLAWVGLALPVALGRGGPRTWLGSGVLSAPRGWRQRIVGLFTGRYRRQTGYAVNALEAVDLLAARDPGAAAWWREHCAYFLDGKRHFVFTAETCEERP